jgi:hypothetical protein
MVEQPEIDEFLRLREAAGQKIDPEIAEVGWWYAETLDPYGVHDLPEELQQVGRERFARSPESDGWVWFGDLPHLTLRRLYERIEFKWQGGFTALRRFLEGLAPAEIGTGPDGRIYQRIDDSQITEVTTVPVGRPISVAYAYSLDDPAPEVLGRDVGP